MHPAIVRRNFNLLYIGTFLSRLQKLKTVGQNGVKIRFQSSGFRIIVYPFELIRRDTNHAGWPSWQTQRPTHGERVREPSEFAFIFIVESCPNFCRFTKKKTTSLAR